MNSVVSRIIAHVDHGKTTLVDALLEAIRYGPNNQRKSSNGVIDFGDIEKEHGITILAKATSVEWKDAGMDTSIRRATPISAARWNASSTWSMASIGAGRRRRSPMPQTKFVVGKARQGRPQADRRDQQDRPSRRPSRRGSHQRGVRIVRSPRRGRRAELHTSRSSTVRPRRPDRQEPEGPRPGPSAAACSTSC